MPPEAALVGTAGMPAGITVAVIGDPGTGKSTLLLTYVLNGRVQEIANPQRSEPALAQIVLSGTGDTGEANALTTLNKLVRVDVDSKRSIDASERETKVHKHLRCFVSLESSFPRMLDAFGGLFDRAADESRDRGGCDVLVFIDASSMLSGRLEDLLRYPKMPSPRQQTEQTANSTDQSRPEKWPTSILSLGGFERDDPENFGLYWDSEAGQSPKRIEDLQEPREKSRSGGNIFPFTTDLDPARMVLDIHTPVLPDPLQRVRLLKDLLASLILHHEPDYTLLAIDSLSALMHSTQDVDNISVPQSKSMRLQLLNLIRWLEENKVSTFMASEANPQGERNNEIFLGASERYVSSGVIQLEYHQYRSGDVARFLRFLKVRGAAHDLRPFAYGIEQNGLTWLEPLVAGGDRPLSTGPGRR